MKSKGLHIFILSIYVLIICSGLLFYRSYVKFDNLNSNLQLNFEELVRLESQVYANFIQLKTLYSDENFQFQNSLAQLKETINIISTFQFETVEKQKEFKNIIQYFKEKLFLFESSLKINMQIEKKLNNLNSYVYELEKMQIKELKEHKNIISISAFHLVLYINYPNENNKILIQEDLKIISQILAFMNSPNPKLDQYFNFLTQTYQEASVLNSNYLKMRNFSMHQKAISFSDEYNLFKMNKTKKEKYLLYIIYVTIFIYIIALFNIIKKSKKIYVTMRSP